MDVNGLSPTEAAPLIEEWEETHWAYRLVSVNGNAMDVPVDKPGHEYLGWQVDE